MALILIGGGSRSGKSRFALELAQRKGSKPGFIATAQAFDDEMRDRIRKHRQERGEHFRTIEEPVDLAGAIQKSVEAGCDAVVVDCLTLWVSNLMLSDREVQAEPVIAACQSSATIILVTNEVGCGIVPENAMARRFRDLAGWLNQRIAEEAQEVYWTVFGIPMKVK